MGSLEYREWTTDDVRHSIHEVVANQVEFLDAAPKDAAGADADPGSDYGDEPF